MSYGIFQFRRGTATEWTSANTLLLNGELGFESDTGMFKLGNGVDPWNALPYGGIKGDTGPAGAQGLQGTQGLQGENGWSPVLAVVSDGERRVLQVVDWVGGTGTKPVIGKYVGPTGFVDTVVQGTDVRGPAGVSLVTNSFATVSVSGTALTAESVTDTLTINAGTGITLSADAATDAFTINNSDTGSSAVSNHVTQADPHPQYLTQTEGDALYQPIGSATVVKAFLTTTQVNNTTTPVVLNGHTFILPPGKSLQLDGVLVFTSANTTTGAFYGVRATQGAGANGNLVGAWESYVNISSSATATGLADGDAFNLAGGVSTPDATSGVLGTASVAGNNAASIVVTAHNTSTNVDAEISLIFRSEVANQVITAQIGTGAVGIIG